MRIIKKLIPFIGIIILWQIAAHFTWVNQAILPAPTQILKALFELSASGELFEHALESVKRVAIGFLIASIFGVSLGIISGYFRLFSEIIMPVCEFLRPIPPIAWIPIAILWFGLGDSPAYFIVFIGAFFPIFINCYWGVRQSRLTYLNMARNLGLNKRQILANIILPGSLPGIISGLRIGLGLAWTSVISAELVGAQSGLGYMIQMNRIMLRTYNIIVGMIVIGVIGLLMNYLMHVLEKKLTFWDKGRLESTPQ